MYSGTRKPQDGQKAGREAPQRRRLPWSSPSWAYEGTAGMPNEGASLLLLRLLLAGRWVTCLTFHRLCLTAYELSQLTKPLMGTPCFKIAGDGGPSTTQEDPQVKTAPSK